MEKKVEKNAHNVLSCVKKKVCVCVCVCVCVYRRFVTFQKIYKKLVIVAASEVEN